MFTKIFYGSAPRVRGRRGAAAIMKKTGSLVNVLLFCVSLFLTVLCSSCTDSLPADADVSDVRPGGVSSASSDQDVSSSAGSHGSPNSFTVAVTGDICLADNWTVMENAAARGLSPIDCISPDLVERMRNADFLLVNNEFCYSYRGKPLSGKAYTFRANPSNVRFLKELGADLAGLANNHVYDYGEDAFLDTLDTLDNNGIPYVGAGRNEDEAYEPYYTEINGVKLAFVAASRAEKYYMTPVTDGDYPGIAGTYDSQRFLREIEEADRNADVVIVYVHWGTEYSEKLQDVQKEMAREYVDAGADVVIGAHAHILQGMEFYNGVPIIYNLGNFWFNMEDIDTVLLELEFTGTDVAVHLVPAVQKNGMTTILDGTEEGADILKHLEDISVGVEITEDGYVVPSSDE